MTAAYDHPDVQALIRLALHEDLRFGVDVTCAAVVASGARLIAEVKAKQPGVLCGMPLFERVYRALGAEVAITVCAPDGTVAKPGDVVWRATGDAVALLTGERTALNLAQRLSGTATATAALVAAVAGTRAQILDTRKTTPGMRVLQKLAVLAGGGANHRHGLHDAVLIKDNHIALMPPGPFGSGPAEAVRRARERLGAAMRIEVEIEGLDDLVPVIRAGADIVLLDNLAPAVVAQAVAIRDATPAPDGRTVLLEASGGITLASVRGFAEAGVDRISTGSMTHSVEALDLSLRTRIPTHA
jgi:nicotinate-nucleotide pyrophosphorylase (carboxylating)